jgi:hypothetical protein
MAILGPDQPASIHWLRTGMMQSRRVARIKVGSTIGTAFYVDGKDLDPKLANVPLLTATQHGFRNGAGQEAAVSFDGMMDEPRRRLSADCDGCQNHYRSATFRCIPDC